MTARRGEHGREMMTDAKLAEYLRPRASTIFHEAPDTAGVALMADRIYENHCAMHLQ